MGKIAPHFPDFEILEILGVGGMGVVYKARQPQLDRMVALKILSHDLASDPAFAERFNREAKVLARLSHPNIVGVFDFGTAGPYCYFLMEYVDGVNLRQAMQAGRFTPAESLAMVTEICSALKFAHEEGILHRDIKPENVLIDSKGRVKIADFGIAKLVDEGERVDVTLTMQGSVLGSPHYMSPEQIETPGDIDQRSDIYSLGVVFYELLTGELPIGRFALPSQKAAMDIRIDEIVLRTLEKERQTRFQTADEVKTQVEALAQNPGGIPAPPAPVQPDSGTARFSLVSAILTGLSLVGIVFGFYLGNEYRDWGLTRETGRVLSLIVLVLSSMMAITGFILGANALGQIRKSGGVKDGLGSAVFGVVAWPILLLGIIGSLFLRVPMPSSEAGRSFGPLVIVFFIGIPQILAGFVLVRGLRRWARGVVTEEGEKRFPGLGRTILAAIGLIIFGVMLLEITSRFLPGEEGRDPYGDPFDVGIRQQAISRMSSDSSTSDGVRWIGEPEIVLPIAAQPGQRMGLRLVLKDGKGQVTWSTDLGELEAEPGGSPDKGLLKVGTYLKSDSTKGAIQALAAVRTGKKSHISRTVEDLRGWIFDTYMPDELSFDKPGSKEFRLATSDEDDPESPKGNLLLEVTVTEF